MIVSKVLRLTTFAVVLSCTTSDAAAGLIYAFGFESGSPSLGPPPTNFGQWRGDRVNYRGVENGITPFEGSRMLRFINAAFGPGSSNTSQFWLNIDLSSMAADIDQGKVFLEASVLFNRVAGDAETDTAFALDVRARSGTPGSFSDLALVTSVVNSDSDPLTWEQGTASLILPTGTRFVQLELDAFENVFNDTSNPEFDGHYADAVTVEATVIPEPPSWVLVLTAVMLLVGFGSLKNPSSASATITGSSSPHRQTR